MKKLVAVAMILCMLLSMAACSSGSSSSAGSAVPQASGAAAGSGGSGSVVQLATGAAGPTSWAYACLSAIAEVVKQHNPQLDLVIESTPGSTSHYSMFADHEIQVGSGYAPTDYWAWNQGTSDLFTESYAGKFYALVPLTEAYEYVFVRADSKIKSLSDLNGRTVFVGDPGAASTAGSLAIVKALNLNVKQVTTDRDEGFQMLVDKRVDACLYSGAAPYSSILSVASNCDIRFIPFSEKEIETCTAAYPYMHKGAIPSSAYDFLKEDVSTLAMCQNINVSSTMDDTTAYELTKAIVENWKEIVATIPACGVVDPLKDINNVVVPVAPGAAKYYEEKGVTLKDNLKAK